MPASLSSQDPAGQDPEGGGEWERGERGVMGGGRGAVDMNSLSQRASPLLRVLHVPHAHHPLLTSASPLPILCQLS